MAYDSRRSGQAMAEFIAALLAMILVVLAIVEFVPVFLNNMGLLKEVREEAGNASVKSEAGIATADRQDEVSMDFIPEILLEGETVSGHFSEKLRMPAANLACWEQVRIPYIAGTTETLRYSNRAGTSEFLSALSSSTPEQALMFAAGALSGAGWTLSEIRLDDACILTMGDPAAPSAVAAVHAQSSIEEDGQTVLTIIVRSAGAQL